MCGCDRCGGWGLISERFVPVVLAVESACQGKWRFSVMFAGVALSEKSPHLGSAQVGLSLWQEP